MFMIFVYEFIQDSVVQQIKSINVQLLSGDHVWGLLSDGGLQVVGYHAEIVIYKVH